MNKYKIKNCPAISFAGGCQNGKVKVWDCQDCTDCVIKQIVEKCKRTCRMRCTNDCLGKKKYCGYRQILQKLDIQEVE